MPVSLAEKLYFGKVLNRLICFSGNSSKSFLSMENSSKMDFTSRFSMATTQLIAHLQVECHTFIGNSECGKRIITHDMCRITCRINFSLESVNT